MKLEIKHLSIYLPYGLKMYTTGGVFDLVLHKHKPEYKHGVMIGEAISCGVKPILRPLSDLVREIEVNGEKFIPYEKVLGFGTGSGKDEFSNSGIIPRHWRLAHQIGFDYWAYKDVTTLISYHFDIYGLIDIGLAIDINTLKR